MAEHKTYNAVVQSLLTDPRVQELLKAKAGRPFDPSDMGWPSPPTRPPTGPAPVRQTSVPS